VYPRLLPQSRFKEALIAGAGAGIGLSIMVMLGQWSGIPIASVPFVTSIVLVLAAPESPPARPRCIIGGHLFCALAGFAVLWLLGPVPVLSALAVGLGVAAMIVTDTLHPPAGINGVLIVTLAPSWTFLLIPVLAGALVLIAFAALFRAATRKLTSPAP
jgi:CBS-domain-containing membrane protein